MTPRDIDRRLAMAREWDGLVGQVRSIDGFAGFLLPPRMDELRQAADGGPVVVVNVSRWRSDALIVTPAGVDVVELPGLTRQDAVERAIGYLGAAGALAEAARGPHRDMDATAPTAEAELDGLLRWMWDVFAEPVLRRLGATGAPEGAWPRVWWCPTGPLALLPVHAAGHHDEDGRAVLDRVVSSYTPTLRALVDARSAAPDPEEGRMLVVGVEGTGDAQLPDVAAEVAAVARLFGARATSLAGAAATRDAVSRALPDHRWVHFACHGEQDVADPSRGGLLLHDGALTVADIAARRVRGEFAYLSSCKSAVGGVDLPDESITLAAALHHAGYRHVVATLWSVGDAEAAQVAGAVYAAVVRDGVLHADAAAEALHHAVRALRATRLHRPSAWTPFAHLGP